MTKQITLSTAAMQILAEDRMRTAVIIENNDASIAVYIGKNPIVSSTNGFLLPAETAMYFSKSHGDNTRQARYAVAASGTPVISIDEEYGEA